MLMRVFHPAISQVRDVRIREVRTHATVPPVSPANATSLNVANWLSFGYLRLIYEFPPLLSRSLLLFLLLFLRKLTLFCTLRAGTPAHVFT